MGHCRYISILLLFFNIANAYSHKIFISPSGMDKSSGDTKENAVYSLNRAFDIAREYPDEAVTINVLPGVYFQKATVVLTENDKRKKANKISIVGDRQDRPIIYGAHRLIPHVDNESGNWVMHNRELLTNKGLSLLISVNGEWRSIARYPSSSFFKSTKIEYLQQIGEKMNIKVGIPESLNTVLENTPLPQLQNAYINFYVKWTNNIKRIGSYSRQNYSFNLVSTFIPKHLLLSERDNFRLLNIFDVLKPGEWYYRDDTTIIYKPYPSENVKSSQLLIPVIDKVLIVNGTDRSKVSNISFQNIIFDTMGGKMATNGYFTHQSVDNLEAVIELNNAQNIIFQNIEMRNISDNAIWIKNGCKNCSIVGCVFDHIGAGGIKIGTTSANWSLKKQITSNVQILHNIITNGGLIYASAPGVIIFLANHNDISYNEIHNMGYTGISVGFMWMFRKYAIHNTISYNHIYNIGRGELDDMGGIYTLGISDGTRITNNIIHDVKCNRYGGWGIYNDQASSNILVKNNLVYNCSSSGYHASPGDNNRIINNMFVLNGIDEVESHNFGGKHKLTFLRNIIVHSDLNFFNKDWSKIGIPLAKNIFYAINDTLPKAIIDENLSSLLKSIPLTNPQLIKLNYKYYVSSKFVIKKTKLKSEFANLPRN
jgi:hypothetical protein